MARASTSYKPGQSGNPKGRPKKGETFREVLEKILEERQSVEISGKARRPTKKEILARVLVEQALGGNPAFMKQLLDRLVGLPLQQIDLDAMLQTPQDINIIIPSGVSVGDSDDEDPQA
jgi:predicted ABC-class ATPase